MSHTRRSWNELDSGGTEDSWRYKSTAPDRDMPEVLLAQKDTTGSQMLLFI
jgi:hypothetical protein